MLTIVVGTRPQIIKTAPVIKQLEKEYVEYEVLHTGQHYDYDMFERFCVDFDIGKVKLLNGGYNMYDTAEKLKEYFTYNRPRMVFIPGDVDSAFIAATVASKLDIPIAHLEAGVRQKDMYMQEEKNRRCIDAMSAILFCPTQRAYMNLLTEQNLGLKAFVGDTNYDLYLSRRKEIDDAKRRLSSMSDVFDFANSGGKFGVLTLHRRENVDDAFTLKRILHGLKATNIPYIWPIHPRAEKTLKENYIVVDENINIMRPADYDIMMALLELSSIVVTDSGGVQKEAYFVGKNCVTIAEDTPWLETVEGRSNTIVSNRQSKEIMMAIEKAFEKSITNRNVNDTRYFGTGNASEYIVDILKNEEIPVYFRRDKEKWNLSSS